MATQIIPFKNEAEWLQLRTQDVTSTEVSALFGLSPYKTEFELYHEKRDGQVVKIKPSERMKWGSRLESAIAYGVAEDQMWKVQPLKVYMRDAEARIGSSFDFDVEEHTAGPGILEIKNVDAMVYKRTWKDDDNGNIEAPEHIEMQVQHQMEVADRSWCAIVALVGGNTIKMVYRKRDPEIGKAIRARVKTFWNRVAAGEPPSADYTRDADLIAQLYSQVNQGEIFDASNDAKITRLLQQYQAAQQVVDSNTKLLSTYKAQILEAVSTAEKIIGPFGSVSLGRVKDTPETIITADMVGKSYGGRKGYRMFKPTWKKEQ